MIFEAIITEKSIAFKDRNKLRSYLSNHIGENVLIDIAIGKDRRSLVQNKFYWGVLIKELMRLGKEQGHIQVDGYDKPLPVSHWGKEEWHYFLRYTFLKYDIKTFNTFDIKHTRDLTVKEFSEYIDRIIDLIVMAGGRIMQKDIDIYQKYMNE